MEISSLDWSLFIWILINIGLLIGLVILVIWVVKFFKRKNSISKGESNQGLNDIY